MDMLQRLNRYYSDLWLYITELRLQTKLIFMYIIIIMFPISFFTLYYSQEIYDNAIRDITKKNQYLIEIEKIHVANNIESMRRTAQMVVADRDLIDFVKTRDEINIDDLISFKMNAFTNVTKLQINNPTIENVRLYTTNPYVNEMWPILFSEKRIAKEPWLAETIKRNGMELWWFNQQNADILNRLPVDDSSKIELLRELDYPKGEHLGVIEISMLLKNFFPKMFSTVNDGKSVMVVFDQKLDMIQNQHNTFLADNNISQETLRHEQKKFKKKETTNFQFTNKETPYLVVSTYLEGLDSYMLNIISLEDIYADTKNTRNLIILGTILLVIILSVLTYVLVSLLLKKMYLLMDSMKRVENGEFDANVDINGHGEIGQLAVHFRNMLKKINSLIADAIHKQAATKEAELKALKTQIDSHFLYNTLENIKMMAEIEGQYQISDAVTSLGEMMRYNLKWKNDMVYLQEELTHIRNYIEIMNVRFDNRITLNLDIPSELLNQEVLKISLQPIVENSVKHGIRPNILTMQGIIDVKAMKKDDSVIIQICDNGVGMSIEKENLLNRKIQGELEESITPESTSSGVGLQNVNERIQLYYGTEYGVRVDSIEKKGTKVIVRMPSLIVKGGNHHV